jgi:hypothetical protein
MISIELALDSDRPAIERLLTEGGLPVDGLELALPTAVVARADEGLAGYAAIEPYGSVLRSHSYIAAFSFRYISTYGDINPRFGAPVNPVTFLLIAAALKVCRGTGRVEAFMRRRTSVAHPEWVGGAE